MVGSTPEKVDFVLSYAYKFKKKIFLHGWLNDEVKEIAISVDNMDKINQFIETLNTLNKYFYRYGTKKEWGVRKMPRGRPKGKKPVKKPEVKKKVEKAKKVEENDD